MIRRLSPHRVSLLLTGISFVLALVSIQLGRRPNYLANLPMFNILAAVMLVLVGAGLVVALVPLIKARGRSAPLWVTTALAAVVMAFYLLDD